MPKLIIKIEADIPDGMEQAVKEAIATYLDWFGQCRVVSIDEIKPEQLTFGNTANTVINNKGKYGRKY